MQNTNLGKIYNQDHAADGNNKENKNGDDGIDTMDNQKQVINDDGNNASGNKDDIRNTESD